MGDFGAKGSVPGYDVNATVDYLQSFNSSWPLLKVEHAAAATITLNATPQTIYTHNLGFAPMYLIVKDGKIDALPPGIGVDASVLAYDGNSGIGGSYSFYYYVFRLPLTTNFTAPNVGSAITTVPKNDDFGFKVAKPGKSVDSTDLRDFSLHSSSRSLMVHKVDYGATAFDGSVYTRTVNHGLSYTPIGFCFFKFGAGLAGYNPDYFYSLNGPQGTQDAYYTLDSTSMVISEVSAFVTAAGDATAVILKDPFAKEIVRVSFP
jgi:hypothetical protein